MKPILIVGNCGSGKTWAIKQLIEALPPMKQSRLGLVYFLEGPAVIVLGKYTGHLFDGSDRLSMAVMLDIDSLLDYAQQVGKRIVAEGDRFTNGKFIAKAQPLIVKIADSGEAGRARRNSTQTVRHLKSIATRVSNITEDYLVADSTECLALVKKLIQR